MSQPVQLRKQIITKNIKKEKLIQNANKSQGISIVNNYKNNSCKYSTSTTNITMDNAKDNKTISTNAHKISKIVKKRIDNKKLNDENINNLNTLYHGNKDLNDEDNSTNNNNIEIENNLTNDNNNNKYVNTLESFSNNKETTEELNKTIINNDIKPFNNEKDNAISNYDNTFFNSFNTNRETLSFKNKSFLSNINNNLKSSFNIKSNNNINNKHKESQNLINLKINIQQTKEFKSSNNNNDCNNPSLLSELRKMETLFLRDRHSKEILTSLLKDEQPTFKSLDNHKINERMRMRMIDWMIEVVNNYKCDDNVFFQSVNLMDDYFKKCSDKNIVLEPSELHLIGVTCMFTCSKYQDIYPLRLKMVYEKIAHKKLSMEDIKKKESEILNMCDFINIAKPTINDFINCFIEEIFMTYENRFHITSERVKSLVVNYNIVKQKSNKLFKSIITNTTTSNNNNNYSAQYTTSKLFTPNMVNLLKHVAMYLAKMNYHDYELIVDKNPSLLAAATVFVSLKICEQINKVEYLTDCFIKKLSILCCKQEQEIIKVAQKILNNAQNFDTIFCNLENLKRVHFNAIIELKFTK